MPNTPQFAMQHRLDGLDLYSAQQPQNIAPHNVADSTNLISYGGEWCTRWGMLACFVTPPSSNPSYMPIEFIRSDGTACIIFANNGKLYFSVVQTPPMTYTEIKIGGPSGSSFALTTASVMMWREGKYVYVVDATGSLYRVYVNADNTYTAVAATAMSTPAVPTGVFLTNTTLDACSDATKWTSLPTLNTVLASATSYETITNATYAGISATDTDTSPDGWQKGGDSMDDGNQANRLYFDAGAGPSWCDWTTRVPTYATTIQSYTDLAIQATNTQLRSATRSFISTDVGALIFISAGTNFTVGTYKVSSVSAGTATMDRAVGTALATAGTGAMTRSTGLITYGRVWVGKNRIYGNGSVNQIFMPGSSSLVSLQDQIHVTDLVIGASNTLTSVQRPFVAGDKGKTITILSGTNFNKGGHTIISVSAGAATCQTTGSQSVGTNGSTGGTGYLSFDGDSTATGHQNYTLQVPTSNVAISSFPFKVTGNAIQTNTQVASFSTLATECEEMRWRQLGPGSNGGTGADQPSLQYVDVRLIPEASQSGTIHVKANNTLGGYALGNCYLRRDYSGTTTSLTDLKIESVTSTQSVLSSVTYNFVAGDVGRYVAVLGASGAGFTVGYYKIVSVASNQATVTGVVGTALATGGICQVVSVLDYSTSNVINIAYAAGGATGVVPFRLGFQAPGQKNSEISWSNSALIVTTGSDTYLEIDISTVSSTVRAATQYLYLQITADLPTTADLSDLFTFGPIASSGNKSIGFADYNAVVTEAQDTSVDITGASTGNTTDGIIESNASPTSLPLTPQGNKAQIELTGLATWTNSLANYKYVYEYGGVFPFNGDPIQIYRLIAKLPRWTDTITSDSPGFPYCTWNHTTGVFIDNTPDLALLGAPTLIRNRNAPPTGASCVAGWQSRLWLAKDSTLYGSWLLTTDVAAGLYYNDSVEPLDPNAVIQGIKIPVAPNDNDKIQNIVPLGQYLLIGKQRSVWVLTGNDPVSGFQLVAHLRNAGIGFASTRGYTLMNDMLRLLSCDAIYDYNVVATPVKRSQLIEPAIAPQRGVTGAAQITAAGYQKIAFHYHAQRFFMFCPVPGGSTNSVVYVYDTDPSINSGGELGWTKFTGVAVTGACSLSGAADDDSMYMGGLNGNLYKWYTSTDLSTGDVLTLAAITNVTGTTTVTVTSASHPFANGDVVWVTGVTGITGVNGQWVVGSANTDTFVLVGAVGAGSYTSSGAVGKVTAIPISFKSRGLLQDSSDVGYFHTNKPKRCYAKVSANEATSVAWAVTAIGNSLPGTLQTKSISGNNQDLGPEPIPADIRGDALQIAITASNYKTFKITAVGLLSEEGTPIGI